MAAAAARLDSVASCSQACAARNRVSAIAAHYKRHGMQHFVRCSSGPTPRDFGPTSNDHGVQKVELKRRQLLQAGLLLSVAQQLAGARGAGAAAGPRMLSPSEQAAVDAALSKHAPKNKAPTMLRLAFHDAGTYDAAAGDGGANASLRFELDRPENKGLKRGWAVIEAVAKELQERGAGPRVSYADLIALAGAHAVRQCDGPDIAVPVGRVDASAADPPGRLPEESLAAADMRAAFAAKGLSTTDLVALSGSHTLGRKGFGEPLVFDVAYYGALLAAPWADPGNEMGSMIGLPSDRSLPDDPACRPLVERYAADQPAFFADFAASYVRLVGLGAVWA